MSTQTPEDNVNKDLTDEQLFRKISRSIHEDDFDALDALVISTEPVAEEVVEPVAEVIEEVVGEPAKAETTEQVPVIAEVDAPSDWTANLPKEAQEELARLRLAEQRQRSESGRVPFLQKKLAELEKKLQEPAASAAASNGQPTSKELEEALAQIAEVDPVTAKALSLLRQEAQGSVKKTESILEERDNEALLNREWEKLTKLVPQAPQVFQLPEWQEWKDAQTPGLMTLASSSYADDVVLAIEKFAKDMQVRYPEFAPKPVESQKEAVKEVAPPVVDPKQVALEEQRTRRLAATTPASAKPAKTTEGEPSDPDALFAHFSKIIRKEDHLDKR